MVDAGADVGAEGPGVAVVGSTLRSVQARSKSSSRQARDDIGRWRKIYYRLREEGATPSKVRAALKLVKDAEQKVDLGVLDPGAKSEQVRRGLAKADMSSVVDERVDPELIVEAAEAAQLASRLEALGSQTMVSFTQLPQDIQDALKRYLSEMNLEPRLVKHFQPFKDGTVERSVEDILNLLDRTLIDNQVYRKGYDRENV